MILTALVRYYDVLAAQGKAPKEGWAPRNVSYALSISLEGELLDVILTNKEDKTPVRPQEMILPEPEKRTVGIAANFLCDNAAYLLGIDSKGKPERALQCFISAKELHLRLLGSVKTPAAKAILAFFASWQPEAAEEHPKLAGHLDGLKKGGNLVFRVAGSYAHEDPTIKAAWQEACYTAQEGEAALCLVRGEKAVPARLHPTIKGVRGGQAMGTSLVSFNAEAYNSYGKEQGANAPVSERAAFAYGTALNYLLADREHCVSLGDATVVFWAKDGGQASQGMMACMLGGGNVNDNDLKAAMVRVAAGKTTNWDDEEISPGSEFYILALAPNAARLSVRFFLKNSFGFFVKRLAEHQQRLEIVRPEYDKREQLAFWQLLRETVNENARDKTPSPVMAGELLRAVLTGGRYPATLLNGVLLRLRAEREVTRGKAAIIKAYYLKNTHPDCPEEVLKVELTESTNPSYRLGWLFSILEAVQQAANPGLNATIKDKYFNAASSTPANVFPILVNLAQKHLRKLEGGLRIHYEKELTAVLAPLGEEFPARLSLPQQGAFQLGYYHATQKRYTKKEDK